MPDASELWSQAYVEAGPSRDDMWDWLETHYLDLRAEVLAHRGHLATKECVESLVSFVEHSSPVVSPDQQEGRERATQHRRR